MPAEIDVFATRVTLMDSAVVATMLLVPPEIAEKYVAAGTRRVEILVNEQTVRRYLFQSRDGEFGIVVGKSVLKDLGISTEEPVIVEMWPDPDPDRIELCEELVAVLDLDPEAAERFYGFTPGRQRSMAVHICGAKQSATRERRALDIAHKLRTYTLHGDRPPED
ncbi:MAG: DUF1905 domain-containing protein [Rhodothermales bacterium]|nr:DUF1905 domain-containing protein [Rhodothermales bacterium]